MMTASKSIDLGIPAKAVGGGSPLAGKDGHGRPCLYTVMGQDSNDAERLLIGENDFKLQPGD